MERPTAQQVREELDRTLHKRRYRSVLRSTAYTLITVAAVAILVATIFLPVMRIYGSSMSPTIKEGEIVVSLKGSKTIQEDGTVIVNGVAIDEPYLQDKDLGICDLEFPFQVPDSQFFVMGDQRSVSVDSRSSSVGCIQEDEIVGRIVFCVWPFKDVRLIR